MESRPDSSEEGLTVGFLGRVPPPLGGAGLELQMSRTAAALERLGHTVVWVDAAGADARFDLLHVFGSEPAVWHQLRHWTRNRSPLVVTPIVVVGPGREELLMRLSARLPGLLTSARMRAQLVRRADALIAGTAYERRLLTRALGADVERTVVLGNGADRVPTGTPPVGLPAEPFALMVGAISQRKRQEETLRSLAGRVPAVVVGEYAGSGDRRAEWERAVAETGALWPGSVEPGPLAALRARALALVHLSVAETQSLAVIEALAQGLPCVVSDIPSHRELHDAHRDWVRLVRGPEGVMAALADLRDHPPAGQPPAIPTWTEVARKLVAVYRDALGRWRRR
jgi:glycosyltransferase involved in cell wall biosynthesis